MQLQFWDYFLSIESDLIKCSRFVEFSSDNYLTHSVEFARIIMAASAEIDTVAKELCKAIDSTSTTNNINDYADKITNKYPNFTNLEISLPKYNIIAKPWDNWHNGNSPIWWRGYNKIKHDRTSHFRLANLENSINAVGGLLLGILYYHYAINGDKEVEISAFDCPQLLDIVDSSPPSGFSGGGVFWGYYLP